MQVACIGVIIRLKISIPTLLYIMVMIKTALCLLLYGVMGCNMLGFENAGWNTRGSTHNNLESSP
jgi:hypothetical protein